MYRKIISNKDMISNNELEEISQFIEHLEQGCKIFKNILKKCDSWINHAKNNETIRKNGYIIPRLEEVKEHTVVLLEVLQAICSIEKGTQQLLKTMLDHPQLRDRPETGASAKSFNVEINSLSLNEQIMLSINDFFGGFYNNRLTGFLGAIEMVKIRLNRLFINENSRTALKMHDDINTKRLEAIEFIASKKMMQQDIISRLEKIGNRH